MTTKRINMHEENMLVRHEALDQLITYLVNDGYDVVGVSRESNKTAEEQPQANARYSVRTGSHNGIKSLDEVPLKEGKFFLKNMVLNDKDFQKVIEYKPDEVGGPISSLTSGRAQFEEIVALRCQGMDTYNILVYRGY